MGALRTAAVWLGLAEDDRDREFERERDRSYGGSAAANNRYTDDDLYETDAEYTDDPEFVDEYPQRRGTASAEYDEYAAESSRRIRPERLASRSGGRATVSPIHDAPSASSSTRGFATHDNLALAPQVALRERAVVSEAEESAYRITTLHPTTYNEARNIGEHFRNSTPVIMNLTEMDESDAKRLVDFAAGLAFGLRGSIERVTNRVFLLSPANVSVTAEDRARIAEGGFFNQS